MWTLAALAWGQGTWSVQTVALRDLLEADSRVAALLGFGLPAYTEFTMQDGLQYVRVRIGCFTTREAAEAWADVLRRTLVDEAVAVPIDRGLPAGIGCVVADVGFRKPTRWRLVSLAGEQPMFEVDVGGHVAYLRYDDDHWRMWQGVAPEAAPVVPVRTVAGRLGGYAIVRLVDGPALCPGRLLAATGDVAIVETGDVVLACRWTPAFP